MSWWESEYPSYFSFLHKQRPTLASAREDGSGCHYQKKNHLLVTDGDCSQTTRTRYKRSRINGQADTDEGTEDIFNFTLKNISENLDGRPAYYSSGTVAIIMNTWNGSMPFSPDEPTPIWTMTEKNLGVEYSLRLLPLGFSYNGSEIIEDAPETH